MKRLAAALVAVLALSACAVTGQPARPGTAAAFDGTTITTAQVAAWGDVQNEMGYAYDPGAALTLLMLRPALEKEAASEGIAFGDEQISAEVKQWMVASNAQVLEPSTDMIDFVRLIRTFHALVLTQQGAAVVQDALASIEANAQISPTYGAFTFDRVVDSVSTLAQAQQDQTAKYGDVSYLVFRDVTGFTVNAQRAWMVEEGLRPPVPSPSPAP